MAGPAVSEDEFVRLWSVHGNVTSMSRAIGIDVRNVQARRKRLMAKGYDLPTTATPGYESKVPVQFQGGEGWTFTPEKHLWIDTGSIVAFSDCHYWPGPPSIAHRALIEVIRDVKPRVVFANGDVYDGGTIGRHPPHGFSNRPTPVQELHACQERLGEVEQAMPNGSELLWNVGNHDWRWERTLATKAEEFRELFGMRLADHFPAWDFQWMTYVNWESKDPVAVFHDMAAGIHAGYNNTLKSGVTTVTGHTHQLEVKPYVDMRGRRYGVQTGTIADLDCPQFEYQRRRPSLACSGFAVLTFREGRLLLPEICQVVEGKAYFRSEVVAA